MNPKEWAERLNGREYGNEIDQVEEREAKAGGVVIVFGASDDLIELRGAIDDEVGAYGRGVALITTDGLFEECKCDEYERRKCKLFIDAKKKTREVEAIWTEDHPEFKDLAGGAAWYIRTDIPHAEFDIMDDGEPYCRGLVFLLADATPKAEA